MLLSRRRGGCGRAGFRRSADEEEATEEEMAVDVAVLVAEAYLASWMPRTWQPYSIRKCCSTPSGVLEALLRAREGRGG